MKNHLARIALILAPALVVTFCAGCEVAMFGDGHPDEATTTTAAPSTTPSTPTTTVAAPAPAVDGRDQLDISSAKSLGTHADVLAQDAAITRTLYAANKEGGSVSLSFDPLNWPTEGGSKKIDGRVFIFWIEGGQVLGGHFDWHGVGQTSKGLENITGGYLSGKKPAPGAPIWFAIVSLDGRERTNVAQSQSNW